MATFSQEWIHDKKEYPRKLSELMEYMHDLVTRFEKSFHSLIRSNLLTRYPLHFHKKYKGTVCVSEYKSILSIHEPGLGYDGTVGFLKTLQ